MTADTRTAEAVLQALIMIRSSMRLSLTSPDPLCTMNTSSPRTDSPISTLCAHKLYVTHNRYPPSSSRPSSASPRLLVGELGQLHVAELQPQPGGDAPCELWIGVAGEHLDVRHASKCPPCVYAKQLPSPQSRRTCTSMSSKYMYNTCVHVGIRMVSEPERGQPARPGVRVYDLGGKIESKWMYTTRI